MLWIHIFPKGQYKGFGGPKIVSGPVFEKHCWKDWMQNTQANTISSWSKKEPKNRLQSDCTNLISLFLSLNEYVCVCVRESQTNTMFCKSQY